MESSRYWSESGEDYVSDPVFSWEANNTNVLRVLTRQLSIDRPSKSPVSHWYANLVVPNSPPNYNPEKGVNAAMPKGIIFYLTFRASDDVFYEAKVLFESSICMQLYFVRVAQHYPVLSPTIQHLIRP